MCVLRCVTCYPLLATLGQADVDCRCLRSLLDIFDDKICTTSCCGTKILQMESQGIRLIEMLQGSLEVVGYGLKNYGSQISSMNGWSAGVMSNE